MQAPYFCLVEGARGPKVPHPSLELALVEARRLQALKPEKRVFVLGTVAMIDGKRPAEEANFHEYERRKSEWITAHPNAKPAGYAAAMTKIAEECGV